MPTRYRSLFFCLILASLACLTILGVRTSLTHNYYYWFLNWNLFLGWLPLLFAGGANFASRGHHRLTPVVIGLAFLWFVFFPNSPYIITDLLHLKTRANPFLQFDIITVFSYATTSLFIGFCSLHIIQEVAKKYMPRRLTDLLVIGSLALSSFGIYLGREVRWNSWDIFTNPFSLAQELVGTIVNPIIYSQTALLFTFTYTIFLVSSYLFFHFLINTPNKSQ